MEYRSVGTKDGNIFYHERGSGDPLILIMGFGADGAVWQKHAAVYEKHFRCIIPDNLGVGLSAQPQGPYSTMQMAGDIIAVMDDAGITKARIAGISMGGAIAQELAINYPERVHSLLLVSTWARFDNYAAAVYENLKKVRAQVEPETFMQLLQLWIFAPPYYKEHASELRKDAATASAQERPQTRQGFEGQLDACIAHDTADRLHTIKCPVLITVGSMDIFTPPAFSELIHEKIVQSQLISFPDGGHVHHWEDLERFNSETMEFFKR